MRDSLTILSTLTPQKNNYYIAVHMKHELTLGGFEQVVLLAALRLGDHAYGVTILEEIALHTGRAPAPGALYTALHRMEEKELITYRDGDPMPARGGRYKRFVVVTPLGRSSLASAQAAYQSLLRGLDLLTPTALKTPPGVAAQA